MATSLTKVKTVESTTSLVAIIEMYAANSKSILASDRNQAGSVQLDASEESVQIPATVVRYLVLHGGGRKQWHGYVMFIIFVSQYLLDAIYFLSRYGMYISGVLHSVEVGISFVTRQVQITFSFQSQ